LTPAPARRNQERASDKERNDSGLYVEPCWSHHRALLLSARCLSVASRNELVGTCRSDRRRSPEQRHQPVIRAGQCSLAAAVTQGQVPLDAILIVRLQQPERKAAEQLGVGMPRLMRRAHDEPPRVRSGTSRLDQKRERRQGRILSRILKKTSIHDSI